MEELLQPVLDWIARNPYAFNAAVFFVALTESLVLLGLLVPGAILLFGAGALIATGALSFQSVMLWTVLGAAAGDLISFLLGHHFHQRLRVVWPFRRYPQMVNRGVDFFVRHGGKSIFMARFIGPLRPIVPAIAGMMNMTAGRFLLIDAIACTLWAPAYLLPGMVFGAARGLAAEGAGRLVVVLLLVAVSAWLTVWLVFTVIRLLQPYAVSLLLRVLDWSRRHPRIRPLAGSLLDPDHPEARGLTILSVWFFVTLWLLLLTSRQVLHGAWLGGVDAYVFHALDGLRTPWADAVMRFFTHFGDRLVLVGIIVVGGAWLLVKGRRMAALHWFAAYACAGLLTWILKLSTRIPRPTAYDGSYSYPSAHAAMSVVVYGFLALLIARELPYTRRWLPYSCAGALIVPVSLSRLYLGVHWFSDVLAGLSLGIFWVALIGIAYDRHPAPRLPVRRLLMVAVLGAALATVLQARLDPEQPQRYAGEQGELHRITHETWRNSEWQALPAYRIDLEGSNEQPLNFQWAGSLETLRRVLQSQGWRVAPKLSAMTAMNWLAPDPDIDTLPVLPEVNDGRHPRLLLIAPHDRRDRRLTVLRLWPSHHGLMAPRLPVWAGKASQQYLEDTLPLITYLRTTRDFTTPLQRLARSLHAAREVSVLQRRRTVDVAGIGWSGEVLLAWSREEIRPRRPAEGAPHGRATRAPCAPAGPCRYTAWSGS